MVMSVWPFLNRHNSPPIVFSAISRIIETNLCSWHNFQTCVIMYASWHISHIDHLHLYVICCTWLLFAGMQQSHHIFLNRCLLLQVIGATARPPTSARRLGSQHYTTVYCSALHCTALCCTAMCGPAHYTLCTAIYSSALHCAVL